MHIRYSNGVIKAAAIILLGFSPNKYFHNMDGQGLGHGGDCFNSGWIIKGHLPGKNTVILLTDCSVRSTDPLVCLFQVFLTCLPFSCGLLGMQCVWESLPGGLQ